MITQVFIIAGLFSGLLTNSYYAGKGEYRKLRKSCIGDTIVGLGLLVMAIWFWNL